MKLLLPINVTILMPILGLCQASPSSAPPIPSADPPPASLESPLFLIMTLLVGVYLFCYHRSRLIRNSTRR